MIDNKDIPIFAKIAERLKQQISNRGYAPGALLPREVELAESFDVSRSTMRNALSVLERDGWIIRKKRYGTIVAPDAMRRKYRKIDLGLFVPCSLRDYQEYIDLFNANLYFGYTLRRAVARGYFIRFFPWPFSPNEEVAYDLEEVLLRKGVDAFVVASPAYLREVVEQLRLRNIPHMALETHIAKPGVNSAVMDERGAMAMAMEKLHQLGHRKVGFLGSLLKHVDLSSSCRRLLAEFLKQADNYGMTVRESYIQCVGADEWNNRKVDYEELARQMLRGDHPTAVVTESVSGANAVIAAARAKGLRVPEDISVVSVRVYASQNAEPTFAAFVYDLDEFADMVLDEIVLNLRSASYRPGVHVLKGRFQEGCTLARVKK